MTTSVKMRPEDKAELDRLQAKLTATTGVKISQQELMARLVRLGRHHLDALADEDRPLTEEEIERARRRLAQMSFEWDQGMSVEDIDDVVYGRDRE